MQWNAAFSISINTDEQTTFHLNDNRIYFHISQRSEMSKQKTAHKKSNEEIPVYNITNMNMDMSYKENSFI